MKHFYFENYKRESGYFNSLSQQISSLDLLGNRPSILDIGCGYGDFLVSLKQVYPSGNFHGLTISTSESRTIHQNRPFIKLKFADQLDLHKLYADHRFDLIVNFHTLSYLSQSDQQRMVKLMIRHLTVGGLLVLGTIDSWIKRERKPKEVTPEYVQYFYSPKIYTHLSCHLKLISSFQDPKHGYRIQLWHKSKPPNWQAFQLYLFLWPKLVKNYLLH